jgi:hypothetical protein
MGELEFEFQNGNERVGDSIGQALGSYSEHPMPRLPLTV